MTTLTIADAIAQFPVRMRRSQVMEMGRKLGLTDWMVRRMLNERATVIKPIIYPGTRYAYFDRTEVINTLFNSPGKPALAS